MYRLIEETNGHYGIAIGGMCIYDITTVHAEVAELLALLIYDAVSQVHVYDVIENWFAQRAYDELDRQNY